MADSKIIRTFAGMKEKRYVITGINQLTGQREELSYPMSEDEAKARLERELESRKRQKYAAHKNLKISLRLPVQLTIIFDQND